MSETTKPTRPVKAPARNQVESAREWVRRFGHTETGFAAKTLCDELDALEGRLRELYRRWMDIAMDIDATEEDEAMEVAAHQMAKAMKA